MELTATSQDDGQHDFGRQWGVHLGLTQGREGSAGENVRLLFSAGLRVEFTGTTQDDGQHHLGRQWGVHLGLTQGGGKRRRKCVFVIQCRAPCGRVELKGTVQDDGQHHCDNNDNNKNDIESNDYKGNDYTDAENGNNDDHNDNNDKENIYNDSDYTADSWSVVGIIDHSWSLGGSVYTS